MLVPVTYKASNCNC